MVQVYLHVDKLKHLSICTLGALRRCTNSRWSWYLKNQNDLCIIIISLHFSVGETGPMRGPGRREIGHGALR